MLNNSDYEKEVFRQLHDQDTYRKLPSSLFYELVTELNRQLLWAFEANLLHYITLLHYKSKYIRTQLDHQEGP